MTPSAPAVASIAPSGEYASARTGDPVTARAPAGAAVAASQNRTVSSSATASGPPGRYATAWTSPRCAGSRYAGRAAPISQTRTSLSVTVLSRRPSALNASACTSRVTPLSSYASRPVTLSHTRMIESSSWPVATCVPSGLKASTPTEPVSSSVTTGFQVAVE
nr:hypothetical protein GCM10020092_076870 [Actinoplanes digitatis]